MRKSAVLSGVFFSVAAFALSACGGATGTPRPESGSTQPDGTTGSSPTALPYGGAPKVADPVNASAYYADPCKMLTEQQVKLLKLPAPKLGNDLSGDNKICNYNSSTAEARSINIGVSFDKPGKGLSTYFDAKKTRGDFVTVFKDIGTVNGFPLIQYSDKRETVDNRFCRLFVGPSDSDAIQITSSDGDPKDPCGLIENMSKGITTTLRKGGA